MPRLDLNCDLGEGAGHDAELMALVTSANVACGAHAGDESTVRQTLLLARIHGVAVGSHPGYEDREHFGRRELNQAPARVAESVVRQHALLDALARETGVRVRYLKLHGALYTRAARDRELADAVAEALLGACGALALLVLPGSALERAGRERGMPAYREFFADRTYQPDGSLTPRDRPDALVHEEDEAVGRVLQLVRDGTVRAADGTLVPVAADSVCLHGDGPHAVPFARRLRRVLAQPGIELGAFAP